MNVSDTPSAHTLLLTLPVTLGHLDGHHSFVTLLSDVMFTPTPDPVPMMVLCSPALCLRLLLILANPAAPQLSPPWCWHLLTPFPSPVT